MPVKTIYPYQVRFVINLLTRYGEFHEEEGSKHWYAITSAAACLESILRGETPADAAKVAQRLEELNVTDPSPMRCGKTYYFAVSLAEAMIEGHRLGLLIIKREEQRQPRPPVWIGIDMGSYRTTYRGNM